MFLKNPDKYADIDLAAQGKCTVCQVEMNQTVAGKPEFTVVHKGRRYQFPGQEQLDMFIANPAKYEIK
jgi:YHS domain-containing protein